MHKLRLLMVNEFSMLNTGYSVYGREVLSRLYNTEKYDIAELACYCKYDDQRLIALPWTVYSNLPASKQEEQEYVNDPINQFGKWRFEDVVLDWKPDIIFSITDPWMNSYQSESPLRKYFTWAIMPTVDSKPNQESWIDTYSGADACFTYSQFGYDSLKEESNGKINLVGVAGGGIDQNKFKPIINKKGLRSKYNIPANAFVVGTVMRNQKRKLFPDLINAFGQFLEKNPSHADKSLLYLHTSYPDLGWDIPRLVKECGFANQILFTYFCTHCKQAFCANYRDGKTLCPFCKTVNGIMPNTQHGVPTELLAEIYNFFDIYIQYSIAEGCALPCIEAAACAIPVAETNYSAMENTVEQFKGYPINIQKAYRESETHAIRVYPSDSHLVEILTKFINLPETLRVKKGRDAYAGALKHYTWDAVAKKWETYFDSVEPLNKWDILPRLHNIDTNVPPGLSINNLVEWAIVNVLGEPEKLGTYWAMRLSRDLQYGATQITHGGSYVSEDSVIGSQPHYRPFAPKDMLQMLSDMCQKRNYWERVRTEQITRQTPIVTYKKVANS